MKRSKNLSKLFNAQSGECYLCGGKMTEELGKPNTAEVEHIVPKFLLAEKGIKKSDINPHNIAAAGRDCNAYKAGKPLYEVIIDLRALRLCDVDPEQS